MDDIQILKSKVENSQIPADIKERIIPMVMRLEKLKDNNNFSTEFENVEHYINTILLIPFGKYSTDTLSLEEAMIIMNKNHYGLDSVKNDILEYISVMKLKKMKGIDNDNVDYTNMKSFSSNSSRPPVLCFVGVQGIGKTTFGKSVAHALNRQFVRISLNALGSVQQLKGESKTIVGSEPGLIIKALIKTQTMNPVILLDEVDKMSGSEDKRFDFLAAVMEFIDPEQNGSYMDHYLDFPIDLSKVFFIFTANTLSTLSAALLDRLEIIRFSSYSDTDKEHIAKDYLLPKILGATGLSPQEFSVREDAWPLMIRPLGFDAGIRQLERNLTNVSRKIARMIVENQTKSVIITPENFRTFIPEDIGIYS